MASGEEEVAQFLRSKDKLASHFEFLRNHNGATSPKSELAADDQLWTHHPVSQVVWQAMVSAADHLDIMEVIAMLAPNKTFITAPFTVARGALVASSQALWVLGPDKADVRQQRGLSIAVEYLNQRIGYQTEQLKVCSPAQRTLSRAQIDDLLLPLRVQALALSKKGYTYTDTAAIDAATRFSFSDDIENAVVSSNLIWRRLGGDAHSLGWQLLLSDGIEWSGDAAADQLSNLSISGDLEQMMQASMWAASFLRVAVERFHGLAGAPYPLTKIGR